MAAALAATVSIPAFAQSPVDASHAGDYRAARARTGSYPANAYGAATHGAFATGPVDRAEAIRQCTALEQRISPTIRDSNLSMFEYRACMSEHGQPE